MGLHAAGIERTDGQGAAEHAMSAQLLAAHKGDTQWLSAHLQGCVHPWLDGYTCAYCELPVRMDGDHRHPGYGIVEHTDAAAAADPDSELRVLHRFCNRMMKSHRGTLGSGQQMADVATRYGVALRRAWLGFATQQFLAGAQDKHFGAKHYERLGLHPARLRNPLLFKKYWVVRKMRCAAHAVHYYAGAHLPARLSEALRRP
ncbi:MAG: hypothetical protein ACRDQ7_00160 [Haloechinothrix sp.]